MKCVAEEKELSLQLIGKTKSCYAIYIYTIHLETKKNLISNSDPSKALNVSLKVLSTVSLQTMAPSIICVSFAALPTRFANVYCHKKLLLGCLCRQNETLMSSSAA